MSTISFIQSTTLRPDQYIAGLTSFGPGRSKIFSNSADSYLKVHHVGPTEADVTEGSGGGSACTTTGRSPTASCSRPPTPTPGAAGPWFCPCSASTSRFGVRPQHARQDLSVHLGFGTAAAEAFRVLAQCGTTR